MLYQNYQTIHIKDGPCRQDLALAWCYAHSKKSHIGIQFTDNQGNRRNATIISLTDTGEDAVKITGQIQFWWPGDRPASPSHITMNRFSGTYDPRYRSGQFEIEYATIDDQ